MGSPEGDITLACTRFGARTVYYAAHMRMAGYRCVLPTAGLADAETLDEANRISQISYRLMTPAERDSVVAEAAVALDEL